MNINVGVVGAGTMGTALTQRISENVEHSVDRKSVVWERV